jgi:hypothetical protein
MVLNAQLARSPWADPMYEYFRRQMKRLAGVDRRLKLSGRVHYTLMAGQSFKQAMFSNLSRLI